MSQYPFRALVSGPVNDLFEVLSQLNNLAGFRGWLLPDYLVVESQQEGHLAILRAFVQQHREVGLAWRCRFTEDPIRDPQDWEGSDLVLYQNPAPASQIGPAGPPWFKPLLRFWLF